VLVLAACPLAPVEAFQIPWLRSAETFCKTGLARLSDALSRDPVRRFMFRFLASPFITGLSPLTYQSLLTQLRAASFAGNNEVVVRIPRLELGEFKEFKIAPLLIKGWRKLGLINAEGRFNIEADPQDIIKKFESSTGMKVHLEGSQFGVKRLATKNFVVGNFKLRPHGEYVDFLSKRSLPVSELHDFLFHMPLLMDARFRKFVHLAARFDVVAGVNEGKHSALNLVLEGSDSVPDFEYLLGPVQITAPHLSSLVTKSFSPERDSPLQDFAWKNDATAYRLARGKRSFGFSRSFRKISLDRDTVRARYLSLVVMEHEIKYYMHPSRLQNDLDLLTQIEAERSQLEKEL